MLGLAVPCGFDALADAVGACRQPAGFPGINTTCSTLLCTYALGSATPAPELLQLPVIGGKGVLRRAQTSA